MVEGEIDNDENDEYIYYFLTEISPERTQVWNGVWGWVVGRYMGCNSQFLIYFKIFLCRLHQEAWGTAHIFQEGWKLKNNQNGLLRVKI